MMHCEFSLQAQTAIAEKTLATYHDRLSLARKEHRDSEYPLIPLSQLPEQKATS
jgi:hypothetical protein